MIKRLINCLLATLKGTLFIIYVDHVNSEVIVHCTFNTPTQHPPNIPSKYIILIQFST
jgi:hypothetical protein